MTLSVKPTTPSIYFAVRLMKLIGSLWILNLVGLQQRDGPQIWRVDANILNKQSRTSDKGWSSRLAVKKQLVAKCYASFRISTDSIERPNLT
jgi:hypothetical protein